MQATLFYSSFMNRFIGIHLPDQVVNSMYMSSASNSLIMQDHMFNATLLDNVSVGVSSNTNVTASYVEDAPVAGYAKFNRYIAIVLMLLSAYILGVLCLYEYKFKHLCKKSDVKAHGMHILSAVATFLLCVKDFFELYGVQVSRSNCVVYHIIGGILYSSGSALVYTILWRRHRLLYADPLLGKTAGKGFKYLSNFTIFGIYFVILVTTVVLVSSYTLHATPQGCVTVWEPESLNTVVLPVMLLFGTILTLFQIILLLLIVHPLLFKHEKRTIDLCRATWWKSSNNSLISKDIQCVVKRLAICTIACSTSTTLLSSLVLLTATGVIHCYWINAVSADMIIDVLATTYSFVDWKNRLFPMLFNQRRCEENLIAPEPV